MSPPRRSTTIDGLRHVPPLIGIVIAVALGAANQVSAYGSSQCPREKAMKAEVAAADARSWRELFSAYVDYSVCDSGSIADMRLA